MPPVPETLPEALEGTPERAPPAHQRGEAGADGAFRRGPGAVSKTCVRIRGKWRGAGEAAGRQDSPRNGTCFVITFPLELFYVGSLGTAFYSTTRRHPRPPAWLGGGIARSDAVNPHPGPLPLPLGRRATSAPSHRADEQPPCPQAPGKQARLVHTDHTDRSAWREFPFLLQAGMKN